MFFCTIYALIMGDKRYIKAPLRYGGGKSLAVGLIVECIPNGVRRMISPFIGGGA